MITEIERGLIEHKKLKERCRTFYEQNKDEIIFFKGRGYKFISEDILESVKKVPHFGAAYNLYLTTAIYMQHLEKTIEADYD